MSATVSVAAVSLCRLLVFCTCMCELAEGGVGGGGEGVGRKLGRVRRPAAVTLNARRSGFRGGGWVGSECGEEGVTVFTSTVQG